MATVKLIGLYAAHLLLLAVTVIILLSALLHWERQVNVDPSRVGTVSSRITAVFQLFFTGMLALIFWLSRAVAVSNAVMKTRSLLAMNCTVGAWMRFPSIVMSIARYATLDRAFALRHGIMLLGILLYLALSSFLQVASSSALGVQVYTQTNSSSRAIGLNAIGNYVGFDDNIGERTGPITSGQNTGDAGRLLWQASRLAMFSAGANDTFTPGIAGRMIFDTLNLNTTDGSLFDVATVNGTGMNVRCYQPTDVRATAFLSFSNSSSGRTIHADVNGYINASSIKDFDSIWLNVSMSTPPYWNSSVPGLNFLSEWYNNSATYDLPVWSDPQGAGRSLNSLPTRMVLQPWNFLNSPNIPYGHHQVAMILATGIPEALVRGTNGSGRVSNFTVDVGGSLFTGYLQAIGCDFSTNQVDVNITSAGLLTSNNTDWNTTQREPRAWSDFQWEPQSPVTMERDFLTIFSPSAPGDLPTDANAVEQGLSPAERLLSRLFNANQYGVPRNNVTIEVLEDAMEHYAASYFWSFGSACDTTNPLPLAESYSADGCRYFREAEVFERSGRDVTLFSATLRARLQVVRWRAIAGVAFSVALCIVASLMLGVKASRRPPESSSGIELQPKAVYPDAGQGDLPVPDSSEALDYRETGAPKAVTEQWASVLDVIQLMRGSTLPEAVGDIRRTSSSSTSWYKAMSKVNVRYRYGSDGRPKLDLAEY